MPMIDVGMTIKYCTAAGTAKPTNNLVELKDCVSVPALMQPSSKIATDYIGDEYTSELLGKKSITGLDFTFAYDGTDSAKSHQYKDLVAIDKNATQHWLIVTYPDGTKFEMLVEMEVSLVPVTPSTEIQYTLSVVPVKQLVTGSPAYELIHIVEVGGTDPLA